MKCPRCGTETKGIFCGLPLGQPAPVTGGYAPPAPEQVQKQIENARAQLVALIGE